MASGDFRVAVDPVQLYISIAALGFFYLSNSATLSVIFGRDLLGKEARDERLGAHGGAGAGGADRESRPRGFAGGALRTRRSRVSADSPHIMTVTRWAGTLPARGAAETLHLCPGRRFAVRFDA